jgi:hypothetical protein
LVLATRFIGEYGAADCHALLERYPQAMLVQMLGAWCEAGGRSSSDVRHQQIPWHAFHGWWAQRFDSMLNHTPAPSAGPVSPVMPDLRIGIVAAHEELADLYGSIFRAFRITSDWLRSLAPPTRLDPFDAFIWDETPVSRALPPPLPALCALAGERPVVAVMNAVNIETAYGLGVCAIARPFQMDELVSLVRFHLSRKLGSTAPLARTA